MGVFPDVGPLFLAFRITLQKRLLYHIFKSCNICSLAFHGKKWKICTYTYIDSSEESYKLFDGLTLIITGKMS